MRNWISSAVCWGIKKGAPAPYNVVTGNVSGEGEWHDSCKTPFMFVFPTCLLSECKAIRKCQPLVPIETHHLSSLETCLMEGLMSCATCKEWQQAGTFSVHFLLCISNEDIMVKRWMVWPLGSSFFQFMTVTLNFFSGYHLWLGSIGSE